MAAAANDLKGMPSSHNPSPSSSSHRKSRWEFGINASSDPKSGDSKKPPNSISNPKSGDSKKPLIGDGRALRHLEVDQNALKKAFLHFVKEIHDNSSQRKKYFEDGKDGRLQCVVCCRSSKDYRDPHGLIMHTYNSDHHYLLVDHLAFHKALCILRGWNYSIPPDNSKAYQFLPANEATANQDDLIMWPPVVIIYSSTGKGKDGRMEGMGNKAMGSKMRDLGFMGGKSKSYGRDGNMGITLTKFSGDQSGLNEAM